MTRTEMTKRLATIKLDTFSRAVECVCQGYGAWGVKHETGLTLAQVNAVFAWCDVNPKGDAAEAAMNNFNYVGSRHHY